MTSEYQLFINGKWEQGHLAEMFEDYNPATGEIVAKIALANREDCKKGIQAAANAFESWQDKPWQERANCLLKAADILEKNSADYAQSICEETGSWIGKANFELKSAVQILRAAASVAGYLIEKILPSNTNKLNLVFRKPLGVIVVITPWNFPLLLALRSVAFAIALGNTVVLKPAEETPIAGGLFLADIFSQADLPSGVLNVITTNAKKIAEVGEELILNPLVQCLSFTGSTAVGKKLYQQASSRFLKMSLELGGKNPLIILADCDLEQAVNAAVFGSFMHQGQICMAVGKIIVEKAIAEEFTQAFVKKVKSLKTGAPLDSAANIGPLINQRQLEKIVSLVADARDKGAHLFCGGNTNQLFFEPAVLGSIDNSMHIYHEEVFGPVACIFIAENFEEAIQIANDSAYGLSAGLMTRNLELAFKSMKQLQTGMLHINDSSVYDEPLAPFGGQKDSGFGRIGGIATIELFTETRWVSLATSKISYPF